MFSKSDPSKFCVFLVWHSLLYREILAVSVCEFMPICLQVRIDHLSITHYACIIIYIYSFSEPLLDRHMPVFTGKCFPSTSKKYSRRYQVPAETERFVWLARDHTLYPGSWSKWKLPLNKITADDVQQAKQWTRKLSLPLSTKLSLITVCKGWVISTRSFVFPTSALKNVHVVTRKLDLVQTSRAPTHAEKHW